MLGRFFIPEDNLYTTFSIEGSNIVAEGLYYIKASFPNNITYDEGTLFVDSSVDASMDPVVFKSTGQGEPISLIVNPYTKELTSYIYNLYRKPAVFESRGNYVIIYEEGSIVLLDTRENKEYPIMFPCHASRAFIQGDEMILVCLKIATYEYLGLEYGRLIEKVNSMGIIRYDYLMKLYRDRIAGLIILNGKIDEFKKGIPFADEYATKYLP